MLAHAHIYFECSLSLPLFLLLSIDLGSSIYYDDRNKIKNTACLISKQMEGHVVQFRVLAKCWPEILSLPDMDSKLE